MRNCVSLARDIIDGFCPKCRTHGELEFDKEYKCADTREKDDVGGVRDNVKISNAVMISVFCKSCETETLLFYDAPRVGFVGDRRR